MKLLLVCLIQPNETILTNGEMLGKQMPPILTVRKDLQNNF